MKFKISIFSLVAIMIFGLCSCQKKDIRINTEESYRIEALANNLTEEFKNIINNTPNYADMIKTTIDTINGSRDERKIIFEYAYAFSGVLRDSNSLAYQELSKADKYIPSVLYDYIVRGVLPVNINSNAVKEAAGRFAQIVNNILPKVKKVRQEIWGGNTAYEPIQDLENVYAENKVLQSISGNDIIREKGDETNYGVDKSRAFIENGERSVQKSPNQGQSEIQERNDNLFSEGDRKIQFDRSGQETLNGRVERRTIDKVTDTKEFRQLKFFVRDEISVQTERALYEKYKDDERIDINGYDFDDVYTYDMLHDPDNELRELFSDSIAEYFLNGKQTSIQDITGAEVDSHILQNTEKSVVRNENGNLIPVYHGTDKVYDRLKAGDIGIHFGSYAQALQRTADKGIDNPVFIRAYLNIENPLYIDEDCFGWNAFQIAQKLVRTGVITNEQGINYVRTSNTDVERGNRELVSLLKNKGYDGIVYNNEIEAVSGKSYIAFDSEQVFSSGKETESFTQTTKSVTTPANSIIKQADSVTETPESEKITIGMSDDTRAKMLNKKSVNVVSFDTENTKVLDNIDLDALQNSYPSYARPIIKKIARDFGILNEPFFNPDIELEFSYSGDSIQESINKQHSRYGDFVKMLSVFSDVIENAVGVETHKDKYTGTRREDTNLKQMYVLVSAFSDETGVYPVKLEVKEFKKKTNKLYLSVVLTKKESRYLSGNLGQNQLNTAPPTSTISISDLVGIVNPSEGDFLKYFPDSMLDSEQIEGKNKALAKDAEKIEKLSEDKKKKPCYCEK